MLRIAITIGALLSLAIVCAAYLHTPPATPTPDDFTGTSKKSEVPCGTVTAGKSMVALAFGQSNSANYGETPLASKRNVYNFFGGKCYKAADPMLGATGNGGSVWTRLGDGLIESGMYDNVIFITIGVGGTEIKRWAPGGDLNLRIADVARQLEQKKLKLTHLFWSQGESNRRIETPKDEYKRMFKAMLGTIRKLGVDAPIYVAVATYCESRGLGYDIQSAQRELVNPALGIYPGADSDKLINAEDRYDDCHFSASGLKKHAEMWLNAIKLSRK